jgi:hypothetical protein
MTVWRNTTDSIIVVCLHVTHGTYAGARVHWHAIEIDGVKYTWPSPGARTRPSKPTYKRVEWEPGQEIELPDDLDESIATTSCIACERRCNDPTHDRHVVGGLAPRLTKMTGRTWPLSPLLLEASNGATSQGQEIGA